MDSITPPPEFKAPKKSWFPIHITLGEGVKQFFIIFSSVFISMAVVVGGAVAFSMVTESDTSEELGEVYNEDGLFGGDCTVLSIDVRDCLVTYTTGAEDEAEAQGCRALTSSEWTVAQIERANQDETIKVILLDVDSYGGQPVAGEEIAEAIAQSQKPVVAWVRGAAASAAYWAVAPADRIIASANSDIGSIGVTMSYVDYSKLNEDSGYTYNQLSTGTFKDLGNPDKPLTDAERTLVKRDLNIVLDNFIKTIALHRDMSEDAVRDLADGSTMLGTQAQNVKLIDTVGGKEETYQALRELSGTEPVVCYAGY